MTLRTGGIFLSEQSRHVPAVPTHVRFSLAPQLAAGHPVRMPDLTPNASLQFANLYHQRLAPQFFPLHEPGPDHSLSSQERAGCVRQCSPVSCCSAARVDRGPSRFRFCGTSNRAWSRVCWVCLGAGKVLMQSAESTIDTFRCAPRISRPPIQRRLPSADRNAQAAQAGSSRTCEPW